MIYRSIILCLLFFCLGSGGILRAEYPEKPITIIVHSKPGSGIDITARQLVRVAAKYTDATILVENKTGGSGTIAMRKVLGKKADGYYILAATKSFISTMLLTRSGIEVDDFYWLSCMVIDPEVLITNRNAKIRTLEDIMEDARQKDGKQRWLGPLVGGLDHLMAVKTWEKLGIRGEWIPYEGGADALAALLGEHGVVYVGNPVDVKGRPDLMIAAIATRERLTAEEFQTVPTFKEKGYDLVDEVLWRGFALKQNTAPEAVAFLNQLFHKVSQDPDWIQFVESSSAQPVFIDHEEFTSIIHRDQQEAFKYLTLAGVPLAGQNESVNMSDILIPICLFWGLIILLSIIHSFKQEWFKGDIIIPIVLIFLSIYLYFLTLEFPAGKLTRSVGPASMPRLWLYALTFFSVWAVIESLKNSRKEDRESQNTITRPLGLIALMFGYLLVVNYSGYYISTFVFLIAGMHLMSYRNYLTMVLSSAGFLILSYLVIYKLLQVPLPAGIWFE